MTFVKHLQRSPGLTPWGVFHNLWTDEGTKYVFVHVWGRQIGLLWGTP